MISKTDPWWCHFINWPIEKDDEIENVLDYGGVFFRIPFVIILMVIMAIIVPFAWVDERREA